MGFVFRKFLINGREVEGLIDTGAFGNFIVTKKIPPNAKCKTYEKSLWTYAPYVGEVVIDKEYRLDICIEGRIDTVCEESVKFYPVYHDYITILRDDRRDRWVMVEAILGLIGIEQMLLVIDPEHDCIYKSWRAPPSPDSLIPLD